MSTPENNPISKPTRASKSRITKVVKKMVYSAVTGRKSTDEVESTSSIPTAATEVSIEDDDYGYSDNDIDIGYDGGMSDTDDFEALLNDLADKEVVPEEGKK